MLHKSRHVNFPALHAAEIAISAGRVVPGIRWARPPDHPQTRRLLGTRYLPACWQARLLAGEALSAGRVVPSLPACRQAGRQAGRIGPACGLPAGRQVGRPFHTGESLPAPVVPLLPPRVAHPVEPPHRRGQIFTSRLPAMHTGSEPDVPNPIRNLIVRAVRPIPVPPAPPSPVLGRPFHTGLWLDILPTFLRPRLVTFHESPRLRSGTPPRRFVMRYPGRNLIGYAGLADTWYRVANDALAGYLLYRGDGELPDFTTAWETFSSLPHTTTGTLPAGHTWHLVTRYRNAYGLVSETIRTSVVQTGPTGLRLYRPKGPQSVDLSAAAGGTVRLRGYYYYTLDRSHAADTWRIYLRSDGNDPDPDNDSPTDVAMIQADGVAKLNWASVAYANGTVLKVTLRVSNGTTGAESDNTDIVTATATSTGPDTPDLGAFLADRARLE